MSKVAPRKFIFFLLRDNLRASNLNFDITFYDFIKYNSSNYDDIINEVKEMEEDEESYSDSDEYDY